MERQWPVTSPGNDHVVSQQVHPRIARFAPDGELTYKKRKEKKKVKIPARVNILRIVQFQSITM